MADFPDFPDRSAERERMIREQLIRRGIQSERTLDAIRSVPRERFVLPGSEPFAYEDRALGICCDQTISQPFMVARMTELLELIGDEAVLEIGTGSGYQTAVLARLAARVFTIERHERLMATARECLAKLGIANVEFRCGDGTLGWPEQAPFAAILVTAGAPAIPPSLMSQLAIGGRLVAPVGPPDDQTLIRTRRTSFGFRQESLFSCRFVKLVGEEGWPADR